MILMRHIRKFQGAGSPSSRNPATYVPRIRTQMLLLTAFLGFVSIAAFSGAGRADEAPQSVVPTQSTDTATDWRIVYSEIQAGFVKLQPIFRKGCFNCHSKETHYPWYHALPGIKQLIDKDIRAARKQLDMSLGFPFDAKRRPADDLARIKEELEEHEMPPWNYRLLHWSANPTDAERDSVITWIDASLKLLAAHGQYPFGQTDEESQSGHEGEDSESSD